MHQGIVAGWQCVKIDDLAIFGVGIRSKAADTLEEFSLEKNISGMRLKARATGNLSTTNLKLDSQLKQQTEYQKPTTPGGGSGSGNTPDPKPNPDGRRRRSTGPDCLSHNLNTGKVFSLSRLKTH